MYFFLPSPFLPRGAKVENKSPLLRTFTRNSTNYLTITIVSPVNFWEIAKNGGQDSSSTSPNSHGLHGILDLPELLFLHQHVFWGKVNFSCFNRLYHLKQVPEGTKMRPKFCRDWNKDWNKDCERKIVKERLWKKDCGTKIVKVSLWKKVCERKIVKERLWKKDC